jgi:hypothetical protein
VGTEAVWAGARAVVVAAAACSCARLCLPLLSRDGERRPRSYFLLLLVPFLTPSLLTGYGYGSFSLSLVHHPVLNELLYSLLLLLRLTPLAALLLAASPAPQLDPSAMHSVRILAPGSRRLPLGFLLRGPLRSSLAAFLVVLLLAFGERELASLLGVGQWTVSLFDAQVGGLALADSLRLGLAPAGLQTVAVVLLLAALLVGRNERAPGWSSAGSPGQSSSPVPAYLVLAGATVMVTLVPAATAFQGVLAAPGALLTQIGLLHDIVASTVLGLAAAALAWLLAGSLVRHPWLMVLACLPGLCGGLQVGLVVLALFQLPVLQALHDTVVPAVLGLTVVLVPYACALSLLLDVSGAGGALHSARLLGASPQPVVRRRAAALAARVAGRGWLWALLILFWLAYCEVTVTALLAPVTLTPAFVRLYNLMHYGRSEVLSVMLIIAVMLPLLLAAGACTVLGQVERRRWQVVVPS